MNEDRFQRLSEYLDGELAEAEASALRAELEADPELAALLAELRAVKDAAGALAERAPDRDLWPAIAALKPVLAIAALEARLAEERGNLDSTTIRIIEESLATIDRAIASATAALESDPGNVWLNRHLADSKSRKVRLLEKAAALSAVRT